MNPAMKSSEVRNPFIEALVLDVILSSLLVNEFIKALSGSVLPSPSVPPPNAGFPNAFPGGTRVFYWDVNGTIKYGTVQATGRMSDGTQVVHVKLDDGTPVQLPCVIKLEVVDLTWLSVNHFAECQVSQKCNDNQNMVRPACPTPTHLKASFIGTTQKFSSECDGVIIICYLPQWL